MSQDELIDESEELLALLEDAPEEEELPPVEDHQMEPDETLAQGTELESFESAEIEDVEFLEFDRVVSILESILFATDRPQGMPAFKQAFKGTNVKSKDIKRALDHLTVSYAGGDRGVSLEEINGGWQLRTKVDNMNFLRHMVKNRPFKLSGPALEVLAIAAYKQPCTKSEIDEIRGVESGHLLRGLMERGLVTFGGKSDLPGKPMLYETTRKFLEIFGLRNIRELPSLTEIDELIPEGIGEVEEKKTTLDELTEAMSEAIGTNYSEGEEELSKITDQLSEISTTTDFFEQERQRERERRDAERAKDLREAMLVGEELSNRDRNWLERYEAQLAAPAKVTSVESEVVSEIAVGDSDDSVVASEAEGNEGGEDHVAAEEVVETEGAADEDDWDTNGPAGNA